MKLANPLLYSTIIVATLVQLSTSAPMYAQKESERVQDDTVRGRGEKEVGRHSDEGFLRTLKDEALTPTWQRRGVNQSTQRIPSRTSSHGKESIPSSTPPQSPPPSPPSSPPPKWVHRDPPAFIQSRYRPLDYNYDTFKGHMLRPIETSHTPIQSWEEKTRHIMNHPHHDSYLDHFFENEHSDKINLKAHKAEFVHHRQDFLDNHYYYDFRHKMEQEHEYGKPIKDWERKVYSQLGPEEKGNYRKHLEIYWQDSKARYKAHKDQYMEELDKAEGKRKTMAAM